MSLIRLFLLAFCLSMMSACANVLSVGQNVSILYRDLSVAGTIYQVHKGLVGTNTNAALVIYDPEIGVLTDVEFGSSRFSIARKNLEALSHAGPKSICFTVYRSDIPAGPQIVPCFELLDTHQYLASSENRIAALERRVSRNEAEIDLIKRAIDRNTQAVLENLRASATNTNRAERIL